MALSRSVSPTSPWQAARSKPLLAPSSGSAQFVSMCKSEGTAASSARQRQIGRIKKGLQCGEISVSGYDTAWVAMVTSVESSKKIPLFPQCIDWILKNQQPDGSWVSHHHHCLIKYALSSTLACVIALKKWNVGEQMRDKGIQFIQANWSAIWDNKLESPIGFYITFAGMIKLAMNMGLYLPLGQLELEKVLLLREIELKRALQSPSQGAEIYMAFVSEGLDLMPEWEKLKKYQRKNGSILDSPSTTAAALLHYQNATCLEYLNTLLQMFGNGVPYQYTSNISIQIRIIDLLEDLGIAHHFMNEIEDILKEAHRLWLENDEEITSSLTTYALAFRLLRIHGYRISAGPMTHMAEYFHDSMDGFLKNSQAVLELYRASHLRFTGELSMKDLGIWARDSLSKETSKYGENGNLEEVDLALKNPSFASLHRLAHRRNIALLRADQYSDKKFIRWLHNDLTKGIVAFAVEEFNGSQYIYQKELEQLRRWIKENRIDQLKVPRQKLMYCYFSAAATIFEPQMADARLSWAKNGVLTTLFDDFFDVTGSHEELINLIQLVDRWDETCEADCVSNQVKILYSALHSTCTEIGVSASMKQGYSITENIINIWRDLLRSFMREAEWAAEKAVPSMEEYLDNGYVSFALGPIILPALYLIGPHVSPDTVKSSECIKLYHLVSTCGRLLNDIQSFEAGVPSRWMRRRKN
ncbi:terpenoid cyclases/Protein prenyltransferases superfamily protein isoform X2 [Wolffia australiana]